MDDLLLRYDTASVRISAAAYFTHSELFTQSIRRLFIMLREKCENTTTSFLHSHPGITLRLRNHVFARKESVYLREAHHSRLL